MNKNPSRDKMDFLTLFPEIREIQDPSLLLFINRGLLIASAAPNDLGKIFEHGRQGKRFRIFGGYHSPLC